MEKVIAISSVLLGIVFLAGCGQQPVSQTQPTPPTPTAQQPATNQPTATPQSTDDTVNWKQFNHTNYKLTFLYPSEMIVGSNNMGFEANVAPNISVFINGENPELNIDAAAVPESKDSSFNPKHYDPKEVEIWDIKKTAEEILAMNKNDTNPNIKNHSVSSMEKITVAGREAYKFSANGSYTDWQEGGLLNQETTYVFTTNLSGTKIRISYPASNSRSVTIIESLKFY